MSVGSAFFTRLSVLGVLGASVFLTGCGYFGGGGGTTVPPNGPTTSAVISVSSSSADEVVECTANIDSIILTTSDNQTFSALPETHRVELSHLAGTAMPLLQSMLPQATYKSLEVDLSAIHVTYVDMAGHTVKKDFSGTSFKVNVPLNPNLTVGTTPFALIIDADLKQSVNIDHLVDTVSVTPLITARQVQVPATTANELNPNAGKIEHVVGQITTTSANSFTIRNAGNGASITFATDANTQFVDGATSILTLPQGSTVRVEGVTKPDASLLATQVGIAASSGRWLEGVIVVQPASPATSIDLLVQDASGDGVSPTTIGSIVTVPLNSTTAFVAPPDAISLLAGMTQGFNNELLAAGQRVAVEVSAQGNTPAKSVTVEKVSLRGVIVPPPPASPALSLSLSPEATFAALTKSNTASFLAFPPVDLEDGKTITTGTVVQVRGLVFGSHSEKPLVLTDRVTAP